MPYECILTETDGAVGIITLHRPDALNAFNRKLMDELTEAVKAFEADDAIGCMVLTGRAAPSMWIPMVVSGPA